MNVKKSLREYDIFGTPVGLTYQGEETFKTSCGGCTAILILFLIGSGVVKELINSYRDPEYRQTEASTITPYYD